MDDYQFGFIFLVFGISTMRATPELECGRVKIGSRPSTRKPSGGIESLRVIPRIFWLDPDKVPSTSSAWLLEQHLSMRFQKEIKNLHMFQEMNNQRAFLQQLTGGDGIYQGRSRNCCFV
ncbi:PHOSPHOENOLPYRUVATE CARBOXYLASE [Salix koriyanagi]|uniref:PHOSPHOENOLPYRUVATE CARBOXYLASE n=1 Tax=Salix koriyanagi TaxID=2511006 RepID=A0A9Q0Z6Z0_9ROSI|nr:PHOSPHOENOLPYRUVATE CARBOXYLASE [Salix koriyanagi]